MKIRQKFNIKTIDRGDFLFYKYIFICFHFLSTFVSNNLLYDVMRAIFIGFSAIMVSIIVFVFGIVFNRKHQLERTFILNKLKIKNVMSLCIIIYFLLFLFSKEVSGSFFIIFKIIVACLIVRLMWLTYKILNNIIRINVDINYFNSELENYVYNHIVELDKKIDDINLKDEKTNQKELDNLIKKKKELSNDIIPAIFNNQYKPIYANKKATVINIDCPKISNDIDKNNKRTRKIGKLNENPKLIIMVNIGDKVVEKSIIGFYLKDSGSYSKNFSQYITYNDKYRYIDEDIKLINGYLIDIFLYEKVKYDDNNELLNYLTFLYNKKLSYIKNKAIDQLINTIKNVYEDNVKNIYNILLLLKKLSLIAYDLDENDDCQKIGNLIFLIYYSQLQQKSDDVVAIMDDFVTDYFKINFLLNNKRGSKNEYYDNLISNILKVFYFLVKVKSIQGISTFFNSLKTFKNTSYKRFESYNFQFIIGMTFCLEMIDNEKLQKEIINWIKKIFIIDDNIDDFTLKFNDYYGNESLTQKTYQTFNCDNQKNVLEKMLTIYDFKHIKEK